MKSGVGGTMYNGTGTGTLIPGFGGEDEGAKLLATLDGSGKGKGGNKRKEPLSGYRVMKKPKMTKVTDTK